MPQFKCVDVGASCKGHFAAENTEELLKVVSEHLKTVHKISLPSRTIMSYISKNTK
ncbi:MAG TPA: DUF1059 domain-containing protein [Actinomycetota bacterium]|nr:DUF1059 domain-containing protein [Actinomycetota bacterium]